jgi:hypothetical protein
MMIYTGVVRIGVIESIIHSWFPELMARITKPTLNWQWNWPVTLLSV